MNKRKFTLRRPPNFKTNLLRSANLNINLIIYQILQIVLIRLILRELDNKIIIKIFPILKKNKIRTVINFKIMMRETKS